MTEYPLDPEIVLDLGNSGTAFRFLLTLLAYLGEGRFYLVGSNRKWGGRVR